MDSLQKTVFAAVAAAAFLLAGCTSGPASGPTAAGTSPITRHITADVTEASMRAASDAGSVEAALNRLANVTFEYTHSGAAVAPKDVTVKFTSPTGSATTTTLADYTKKASLAAGDRVTLRSTPAKPINVLSPLSLEKGTTVLAARTGVSAQWFKATGYPLPVAASKTGTTAWDFTAKGGVDLQLNNMKLPDSTRNSCDQTGCHKVTTTSTIDHLGVNVQESVTGTVTAASTAASALALSAHVKNVGSADISAKGVQDDEPMEASLKGDMTATLDGSFSMAFDLSRELKSITYSGEVTVDGNVQVTGVPGFEAPDGHPWKHEKSAPRTEPVTAHGAADASITAFLQRLWSLDLSPGDEVRIHALTPTAANGAGAEFTYVSQVLGKESRTAAGASRQTLKVQDSVAMRATKSGATVEGFAYDFTYWIDAKTYAIVYAQGDASHTYGASELQDLYDNLSRLGNDSPALTIPAGTSITLTSQGSITLKTATSDLQEAAVLSFGAARMLPLLAFGASFMGSSF